MIVVEGEGRAFCAGFDMHEYAEPAPDHIALCCDLLVMADDARIGYMPTHV